MTSERTLLTKAQANDPDALAELYDRYAPKMYAYIYRRVGDPAVAEDLTGELFLRVLQAVRNERAWRRSFVAWLYRAAHNLVVDHYRRRPSVPHLPLDEALVAHEANPAATTEAALSGEELRLALARLTQEQQEVLVLRFGEGLTARQVGQVVGKTTGSVEALQRRGIAALRRILVGDEQT